MLGLSRKPLEPQTLKKLGDLPSSAFVSGQVSVTTTERSTQNQVLRAGLGREVCPSSNVVLEHLTVNPHPETPNPSSLCANVYIYIYIHTHMHSGLMVCRFAKRSLENPYWRFKKPLTFSKPLTTKRFRRFSIWSLHETEWIANVEGMRMSSIQGKRPTRPVNRPKPQNLDPSLHRLAACWEHPPGFFTAFPETPTPKPNPKP